jgi:predicted nucleotidyltransferase
VTREEAIRILQKALPGIKERYGVQALGLFGSVARNEAGTGSDVDVLVAFEGPARFRAFMGLQFELEELLGSKVDLVSSKSLKPLLRAEIERDLIHVA